MNLKKISAYTVYINPATKYYWVRIRMENSNPEIYDIELQTLPDLTALVDVLRNEANTLFDWETKNVVIGWEAAGENSPDFKKH